MRQIALRSVRAHWGRLVLSVLAVLLGVAFMTGTLQLRAQLGGVFDKIVETSASGEAYVLGAQTLDAEGATSALMTGQGVRRNPVQASLVDTIEAADGVAGACPDYEGMMVLIGADGTPVAQSGATSYGIGYCRDYPYTQAAWVEGRAPAAAGEIGL
ncbi:MAG: hypothetical protein LBR19_08015, partial [Bifidobacteriaceae bacterium]|nr:hypothetical protein [Bifidobacteriaceae bacterium]